MNFSLILNFFRLGTFFWNQAVSISEGIALVTDFFSLSARFGIALVVNMASTQDTANAHTNQMGDFIDPLCFSRALPPNQSPHRMGVSGPT